ncbi:MAG TPA: hypothetical protein VM913_00590 [Sphingomicrobium sp.]|nr:hypothetical protein [Sphingomicrobium sp.]
MDESADKKRFHIFMALRLGGLLLFFVGVAVAFTAFVRPGGLPVAGVPLAFLGLAQAVLAPKILKRITRV